MSAEANKKTVEGYYEQVWNNGRLDLVPEYVAADFSENNMPQIPGLQGWEALKAIIGGVRQGLPDIQISRQQVIAEDDTVVAHYTFTATHQGEFMGVPATGNRLTVSGAAIFRLAGGKIAEIWNFGDNLGMMQQLGLVPTPEAG